MISPGLEQELRQHLDTLTPEQQRRVVDFARTLAAPKGVPGSDLLHFAGTIEPDDLALISDAIEADCERINADEW